MRMSLMNWDANSLLLFGIVTLLACGVAIGGSIQPSRVLIAISIVVLLRLRAVAVGPQLRLFIAMGSIWVLWGILSLLWTPDFYAGWDQVVGIGLGIVTAAVVSLLVARAR